MDYLRLGASLYVPSTRNNIIEIANQRVFPNLRSVIFCTEDSLAEQDIALALENLDRMLRKMEHNDSILRFIRVRNPTILASCLNMGDIHKLDGFVLPKITRRNLDDYWTLFKNGDRFRIMLTLETLETFDSQEMIQLRTILLEERYRKKILSIRIGGNDLLHLLSLRRSVSQTIYSTPLAHTIPMLVSIFKPFGFNLTGPVFEALHNIETLKQEVQQDMRFGLFGKTAIHPDHVSIIEDNYRVYREDLEMAEAILRESASAVFSMHGYMCEPATHSNWARVTLERARLYGVI